jgi:hypothetical protein
MKHLSRPALATFCLLLQSYPVSTQTKAPRIFFLEDNGKAQWCAFNSEATWKTAIQDTQAMTVGTLTYSDDHLSQIDVTETDESGDWTVYDQYFLDDQGCIVKLSRMINVLPGDRSVSQFFSIREGRATKTLTTVRRLSTGKALTSPKPIWLPELPVETSVKMFAFSRLLRYPGLRTTIKTCVQIPGMH